MKIVKILGGLGNQMFQYAFYLSLCQRFKNVKVDLSGFDQYQLHNGLELGNVFSTNLVQTSAWESSIYGREDGRFIVRKLRRFLGTKSSYQEEKQFFGFEPEIYEYEGSSYYWGYWQNFNYFIGIEPILRRHFVFNRPLSGRNAELLKQIHRMNAVSLHVRRGDYLQNELLGNVCDLSYIENALKTIKSIVLEPTFVIFSNDIAWCKENLRGEKCIYVDWNMGEDSYCDLQLMSSCNHNIIANSSFSWWGAWLNRNPEQIVISPRQWMNLPDLDYSGINMKHWITI
ncbi:alpha-1,2-fucosyltransferase [Paradesertivirga mongoliensis]|uniref:Alpha-1,2-fucosyltransferase n=1 Tax=Paradesertivirga mongoliensis TaxID=2100740 RepID=A0ABW4ZJM7_9SPHI|nr:alpha-1,2-fucosyltransferase [Pedobacter mongoliensis]